LKFVGKRWALRFLLLALSVTSATAQTIVFRAVPANATVQCISNAPATLLTVTGPIPFGMTSDIFAGSSTGSTFSLNSPSIGAGKEGKINLGNYLNTAMWLADMTTNGCNCTVSVGSISTITGNAQVDVAFNAIGAGAIVTMPVVDQFNGSGPANIVGFIVVQVLASSGNGANWSATVKLLSAPPSAPNVTALSSCGSITNVVFHETSPNGTTNVIIRTWTANNSCGNTGTATQLVTVADNQPPIISCPANIIVTNASNTNGVVVTFAASATDYCDGSVPVICTPASGSTFGPGITPVNCMAVDAVGNQTNCTFYVAVLILQINSITPQGDDVLLTWTMPQGCTGVVQATGGDINGGYNGSFTDISAPVFVPGDSFFTTLFTTNYLDIGGATNIPSRFYRIRLPVPSGQQFN